MEMRDPLTSRSIHDQRMLLSKVVVAIEMGPTSAELTLPLPHLDVTGKLKIPQGTSNARHVATLAGLEPSQPYSTPAGESGQLPPSVIPAPD
jgi:hypothetical protein